MAQNPDIPIDELKNFNNWVRRHNGLDSMRDMSDLAAENFIQNHGEITPDIARENFSQILEQLIRIEQNNFRDISDRIQANWTQDIFQHRNHEERFPNILNAINHSLDVCDQDLPNTEKLHQIISNLASIIEYIVSGLKQAAKTRAGYCLENHIQRLFRILDIPFDEQVPTGNDTQKLDLVLPSEAQLIHDPFHALLVECQTTLKDRFRLTQGRRDGFQQAQRFLATATGGNVITMTDNNDITDGKLEELREHNIRLIVFQRVQDNFPDNATLISYEDLLQEIVTNQAHWN